MGNPTTAEFIVFPGQVNTPTAVSHSSAHILTIKHEPFNWQSVGQRPGHAQTRGTPAALYLHVLRVSIRLRDHAGHHKGSRG